jgi:hypothetical protein
MLELRGRLPVPRDDRPAILFGAHGVMILIEHRLDGEHHGCLQLQAGRGASPVQHAGRLVHLAADAMAAILSDDRVATLPGMALDGMAYGRKPRARTQRLDPFHMAS